MTCPEWCDFPTAHRHGHDALGPYVEPLAFPEPGARHPRQGSQIGGQAIIEPDNSDTSSEDEGYPPYFNDAGGI